MWALHLTISTLMKCHYGLLNSVVSHTGATLQLLTRSIFSRACILSHLFNGVSSLCRWSCHVACHPTFEPYGPLTTCNCKWSYGSIGWTTLSNDETAIAFIAVAFPNLPISYLQISTDSTDTLWFYHVLPQQNGELSDELSLLPRMISGGIRRPKIGSEICHPKRAPPDRFRSPPGWAKCHRCRRDSEGSQGRGCQSSRSSSDLTRTQNLDPLGIRTI